MEDHINQHWSGAEIALSYAIAVTSSFCTIQLMEQWRQYENATTKRLLLVFSAFTLGGCGIWCTHFTGMNALRLKLDDGTVLEIHYEVGMTIISFVFPVLGVMGGLWIASTDPFFLEVNASQRKSLLVKRMAATKMKNVVNKSKVAKQIKITALFSRPGRILIGGVFAAAGVLGMHYLGMWAQRANAHMAIDNGFVAMSCVVALGTATAAFWILFRALTFWQDSIPLRVGSALIMGIAVCGTHYTGMAAASYTHSEEDFAASSRYTLNGIKTSVVASHVSILLCYWFTSLGVLASVKGTERARSQADENASNAPTPSKMVSRLTHSPSNVGMQSSSRSKVYVAGQENTKPTAEDEGKQSEKV